MVGAKVRKTENWQELIQADDLDALIVATPSVSHAEIGIAALQAGKHLLLEKPIALTLEDAARLCAEARRTSRVAAVGFYLRYLSQVRDLRASIQQCGDPTGAISSFHNHLGRRRTVSGYERARATGGGVLYDLAYHHIDLYSFLFDSPAVAIDCRLESRITEDDIAFSVVTLANGVRIAGSFSSTSYNENKIDVYGTDGRLSFDMYRTSRPRFRPVTESNVQRVWKEFLEGVQALAIGLNALPRLKLQPFVAQLEAFRAAALGRSAPVPHMESGETALRVVQAAYESSKQLREIAL